MAPAVCSAVALVLLATLLDGYIFAVAGGIALAVLVPIALVRPAPSVDQAFRDR